jgi:hypothetical protein
MTDDRALALDAFNELIGVEGPNRITAIGQRGRDPQTARFTFTLGDGRTIRIGTIDTLWSQPQLGKVVAVTMSASLIPVEPKDWRISIAMLVRHVIEVEETPGESLEDAVSDWLGRYMGIASTDPDGAAATGAPFIEDAYLHVNASDLARYIRREYTEQIRLNDLRQALADLGYERVTINYVRGEGKNRRRSSTSYYRAPIEKDSAE